jgi:hypothetical protein
VNAHGLRIAFGAQLAPAILDIANQLFLLRINGNGGLPAIVELFDLRVDKLKLRIAVGMGRTLACLPVGMQAEAKPSQQPADQFLTCGKAALGQRLHEVALAPADPQQGGLRVSTDRRLHQLLQRCQKPGLCLNLRLAAAPRSTNAARQPSILRPQLCKTTTNRAASDTRRLGHRRDAAPTSRTGLGSRERSSR